MGKILVVDDEEDQEELKKGTKAKVTVEDIGGTECQKCHY